MLTGSYPASFAHEVQQAVMGRYRGKRQLLQLFLGAAQEPAQGGIRSTDVLVFLYQ